MPKAKQNGSGDGPMVMAVRVELDRLRDDDALRPADQALAAQALSLADAVDRNPGSQNLHHALTRVLERLREHAVDEEDKSAAAIIHGVQVACVDPAPELKPFTRGEAHPQNGTGLCKWCYFERENRLRAEWGAPPITISEFVEAVAAESPGKVDTDAYWSWRRRQMGME